MTAESVVYCNVVMNLDNIFKGSQHVQATWPTSTQFHEDFAAPEQWLGITCEVYSVEYLEVNDITLTRKILIILVTLGMSFI